MKILILKLSSFGDLIHSLPVLNAIKEAFPKAQIDWLLAGKFAPLLDKHPNINKLFVLKSSGWFDCLNELRKEKYDLILDLQGLIKSALIARLIGAKKIIGISPAREPLCEMLWTEKIFASPVLEQNVHVIERNLQIIKALGLQPENAKIEFALYCDEATNDLGENFIALAPESRWESKNWPLQYWQTLISQLLEMNCAVVVLGEGHSELNSTGSSRVIDLRGKTKLSELKSVLNKAQLVIGSDSGVIHLAAALGKNTLGLFGPTSPLRTGPWGGNYLWTKPACSPCHKRKCTLKDQNYLQCLYDLKPEIVLQKVQEILKSGSQPNTR